MSRIDAVRKLLARRSPRRRPAHRLPASWLPATRAVLNRRGARPVAGVLVLCLVAALAFVWWPRQDTREVTAYFPRTVGVYPGSDVRILGVRVGEILSITPEGERVRVEMQIQGDHKVPADAQAAIINSSVVSDRYLQLLPAYQEGPVLPHGAVIPEERTAVPVELDRVYESLDTLADGLGPEGANEDGALSRLLGVSADNLDGQGERLHRMVEDFSEAITTLSDGREDFFGTVESLQVFTSALAADDDSVRAFNDSLAEVSEQLAGEREDLGLAMKHLSTALAEVAVFVEDNKGALTENVRGLSEVTKVLVEQRSALEEIMDVAPTGLSNLQNAYNPSSGTLDTRNNVHVQSQDPAELLCSLLKTADKDTNCAELDELFAPLPELPQISDTPGGYGSTATDPTLGGILEVRS